MTQPCMPLEETQGLFDSLFHLSEPGDGSPSHLALWFPHEDGGLSARVYVIVYVEDPELTPDLLFRTVLHKALKEHAEKGESPYMAAMYAECYMAPKLRTENPSGDIGFKQPVQVKNRPGAVEVVLGYGADREGRRYRATKYLTGPTAGLLDGIWTAEPGEPLSAEVDKNAPIGRPLRRAVGLPF